MKRPLIYVDFNEMLDRDLVLLSRGDTKRDVRSQTVEMQEGVPVTIYMDDPDINENSSYLVADGVIERNQDKGWSKYVLWCCRIDSKGIRHQSELPQTEE